MEKAGGGSKLMQMQARFKEKQMQEREMKIASLYEAQQARALDRVRHSPATNGTGGQRASPPAPIPHHPGKVRQMFEERRTKTKAGIDKSYPLQPIHNTDRPPARKANGVARSTRVERLETSKATSKVTHSTNRTHNVRKPTNTENLVNGSGDLNHNHEPDLNSVKMLPHSNGEPIPTVDEVDRADNNYLLENETFPDALEPAATPRSPEAEPRRPPRRAQAATPKISPAKKSTPVAPPRRVTSENTERQRGADEPKPRGVMQGAAASKRSSPATSLSKAKASAPVSRASSRVAAPSTAGGGAEGAPCAVCGRRFAPDRLDKHQEICRRAAAKKRKPFDALKHRLAGTEAEPFINKLRRAPPSAKDKPLNSTWRQKHADFINAIRAAKQVQAHLNAGGKLSDLPPPPPSENPDYVQCPHCQRRFNQAAAERHIPKCQSFQFNKPKPGQGARRR